LVRGLLKDQVQGFDMRQSLRLATVVTDFSLANAYRAELGDGPFDGLLGADILVARAAVLDYGGLTLYLQEGGRSVWGNKRGRDSN
jgi:hypothetical protein